MRRFDLPIWKVEFREDRAHLIHQPPHPSPATLYGYASPEPVSPLAFHYISLQPGVWYQGRLALTNQVQAHKHDARRAWQG